MAFILALLSAGPAAAQWSVEAPEGFRDVDVLMAAHRLRVERGDHHVADEHLADAIESLLETRDRLEPAETR